MFVILYRVEGLCFLQLVCPLVPGTAFAIGITSNRLHPFVLGFPALQNTFVDLVNHRGVAVCIVSLWCGTFVMPHPPTDGLHLSATSKRSNRGMVKDSQWFSRFEFFFFQQIWCITVEWGPDSSLSSTRKDVFDGLPECWIKIGHRTRWLLQWPNSAQTSSQGYQKTAPGMQWAASPPKNEHV